MINKPACELARFSALFTKWRTKSWEKRRGKRVILYVSPFLYPEWEFSQHFGGGFEADLSVSSVIFNCGTNTIHQYVFLFETKVSLSIPFLYVANGDANPRFCCLFVLLQKLNLPFYSQASHNKYQHQT